MDRKRLDVESPKSEKIESDEEILLTNRLGNYPVSNGGTRVRYNTQFSTWL
ncbi:MAG: hypothetical protein AB8B50_06570 [Pirellulaceae bacterium]